MLAVFQKWLFNICNECDEKATVKVNKNRYCQRCFNREFQRMMELEAKKRGI